MLKTFKRMLCMQCSIFLQTSIKCWRFEKYPSGNVFVDELPSNAIKEVYPSRGGRTKNKLCSRHEQSWSCDTGICNRRTLDQKIEMVTGILTVNCKRQGILDQFLARIWPGPRISIFLSSRPASVCNEDPLLEMFTVK